MVERLQRQKVRNKCSLRRVGSETGREAISPHSPFSSPYFSLSLLLTQAHERYLPPRAFRSRGWGEGRATLSLHFVPDTWAGAGGEREGGSAPESSPQREPCRGHRGQPGAGAPARAYPPARRSWPAPPRRGGRAAAPTAAPAPRSPCPHPPPREGNSSWMSALPAGAAPGGAAAAAGAPHQQRPEAAPRRRHPRPYRWAPTPPRALPDRSPPHHRTWNHPPCQTSWPEDGRGAAAGTAPSPTSPRGAAQCGCAPPGTAAARASPAPGPGRSEPNPRRPAASSLPLLATGPWQRRPGGAWALRSGSSGAGAAAAWSAPGWRPGRLPCVRPGRCQPGAPTEAASLVAGASLERSREVIVPPAQPWWGRIWSTVYSCGFHSTKEIRNSYSRSSRANKLAKSLERYLMRKG